MAAVVSMFFVSVICYGRRDHIHMFWGCWWEGVVSLAVVPIDAGHGGLLLRIIGSEVLLRVLLRGFEYHSCFWCEMQAKSCRWQEKMDPHCCRV